jgi:hypothetical protein
MKNKLVSWAAFIVLMSAGSAAVAYHTHGRWYNNEATLRAHAGSFPAGSAWRSALRTVAGLFNKNPSEFRIIQRYDDASVGLENGQSEVWFSNDPAYDPAWTFWWYNAGGYIVEADVIFYSGESYTTSMQKHNLWAYGGPDRPFQTTALHEYGHVAGLKHENQEYNLMGIDYTHINANGYTAHGYVGEDASHGLVKLYTHKDGISIENVGVTLFKWTGVDGEYSVHGKCTMTSGGVELTYTNYTGQRRYDVNRGQSVRVWFTYENSGETTQTVKIGYYISTDAYVTTADRLIDTRTFVQQCNNVDTRYVTLTIPADLVPGTTYRLGAIVDYDGSIKEVDEQNTASHIILVH